MIQAQLTRRSDGFCELRLLAVNGAVRIIDKLTIKQAVGILSRLGNNFTFVRGL